MKDRLKKCPFCNDIWFYVSDGDYYSNYETNGYRVQCLCKFAWNIIPWCETKEEVINKWDKVVNKINI